MTLEQRIATLEAKMAIALGRLDAIHTAVHTLVRVTGKTSAVISERLIDAAQRVEADATAAPIPDAMAAEMQRVLGQLAQAARLAAAEAQEE